MVVLTGNSKEGNKAGVEASGKILAQVLPVVNNASYSVQDLKATTIKNLMIWAEVVTPLIEEHGQDPLTRFKDSSVVPTEVKSKVKNEVPWVCTPHSYPYMEWKDLAESTTGLSLEL
ncbi:hypothetical protein CYMTET_27336 [Cymbomonas tetramitiformis]|uniref:Uncharacterized protein n=1 Tax=Cymbomonas tetramitiformis TaxID=36881 RepID=A0AAE0FQB8_9CHLO|nr:hypothetical protein CYMTET_27336 [Cymbomonas tetramitiformis]